MNLINTKSKNYAGIYVYLTLATDTCIYTFSSSVTQYIQHLMCIYMRHNMTPDKRSIKFSYDREHTVGVGYWLQGCVYIP